MICTMAAKTVADLTAPVQGMEMWLVYRLSQWMCSFFLVLFLSASFTNFSFLDFSFSLSILHHLLLSAAPYS